MKEERERYREKERKTNPSLAQGHWEGEHSDHWPEINHLWLPVTWMANDRRFDTGNFAGFFFGHVIHHHQDILVALEYVEVRSCTVIVAFRFFFSLFMCVCVCVRCVQAVT